MYKTTKKTIASMLLFILTLTQLSLIGIPAKEVYAANNENVEFDAYFIVDEKETHSATKKPSEGNSIYGKIKVNNTGYLKNAQIEFKDENAGNANFKLINQTQNTIIQKIDEEKSIVTLNQINSGKEQVIEIPITFNYSEEILPQEFSKESKVIFTANYIDKDGEENKIEKEITIQQNWKESKDDMEAVLEENVTKFIPYTIGEQEGLIVQTAVVTSITNNTLPIKSTTIEAKVPTLNGTNPTSIKVYATSTKATNAQETGVDFTEANYTYNQETNILTITVQNTPDENGKIKWVKNATDEYKITYTYSKEVKDYILSENLSEKLNLETKATIDLYTYGTTTEMKTVTQEVSYTGQIGNIAEVSIANKEQSLSKGYIYANYSTENKIETDYEQAIVAEVISADLTDKIVIEQSEEYFIESDGATKHSANTYYKSISINKNIINKILGENAEIKIYSGETLLETINSEKIAETEETMTIDLTSYNVNDIKIETSKPVTEGELIFNIQKAIKGTLDYSKAQIQEVQKLNTTVKATVNGQEDTATAEITLTEPETKAEIVIDKTDLSTIVKNEDVQIKAILRTDNINNKLFTRPTLTIKLPKYIETIEIKDTEILFDKELTINSATTVENTDGTKSIVIELNGEQTKYSIDSVTGGANVVITADLTVNTLTSNRTEEVIMSYTNKNTVTETKEAKTTINFVAPTGVVTTSSIEGYAEGKEKITAISGEAVTAEIPTMQSAREATFNMSVINNYNNTIDTISILGRLPVKGNKNLLKAEDLGSTFDMALKSAITVTGVDETKIKVYYSTNAGATKDLQKAENNWTTTPESYETVKSYLIVVNETLNTADAINFTYTAQIPENLQFNEKAVENYIVYFNNNMETGTIEDTQLAAPITITTGLGPVLEANLTSNIEQGKEVLTGNIIKYTLNVKNIGTKPAQNVDIKFIFPNCTEYIQEGSIEQGKYTSVAIDKIEEQVEQINVGDAYTKDYYVVVADITEKDFCKDESHFVSIEGETYHSSVYTHSYNEYKLDISAKASVKIAEFTNEIESNVVNNKIKKAMYQINTYRKTDVEGDLEVGDEFIYVFDVRTTESQVKMDNTIFTTVMPEGLTYKTAIIELYDVKTGEVVQTEIEAIYNKSSRALTINLGSVEYLYINRITITSTVDELFENEYSKQLIISANVTSDDISEDSEEKQYRVVKEGLEISQTANIPNGSVISAGEKLVYTVTLKNIGSKAINVTLKDIVPDGITFNGLLYDENNNIITMNSFKDNIIEKTLYIAEGETKTIKISFVANIVSKDTKVTHVLTAFTDTISEMKSNEITYIIETTKFTPEEDNEDNPSGGQVTLNKLGGVVWKDENKNGIKENTEQLISDVELLLLNMDTNILFTQNGEIVKTKTNENGIYTFNDVPAGNYTIIFLYDTTKYSVTAYQAENVSEDVNSDAIDTNIVMDGETKKVAITNTIKLEETNLYNIDLGLVDNPKFDLKISKSISKITVQDPTEVKVYEYDENTNLIKLEFVEKYLGQTTIVVEYKITVTNEGAVEGYVKKIADYLPVEMSFSSELNRDWYVNENGTIYNASLANTKIQPGETKEVILTLTKLVNTDSLGTISNTAEIYEAYNAQGLEDYDSKVGNNASNEDDLSRADIVLSIKTGKVITFIGLTLSIILIIGTSAYFIKKKVLR